MAGLTRRDRIKKNISKSVQNIDDTDSFLIEGGSSVSRQGLLNSIPSKTWANSIRNIANYATFNSTIWLNLWCTENGGSYAYECTEAIYNGVNIPTGDRMTFTATDFKKVIPQLTPRNTITAYAETDPDMQFKHDNNWLTFLRSIPISNYLLFWQSPFTDTKDTGFPLTELHDNPFNSQIGFLIGLGYETYAYGDGFDIEWTEGDTWSFTIKYLYIDSDTSIIEGHTITFTETGYTIDGASVSNANLLRFWA